MSIQKLTPAYLWLHAVCSRFVAGAVTAFLTISSSATVGQAMDAIPALNLKFVLYTITMGGLIGAATYLKENPLPETFSDSEPASNP